MNDYGVTGATTGVEVLIKLPVHEVWSGITAIERYGEWSPECIYGAWLEKDVRFEARNRFPDGFETYVTCTVTVSEEQKRFGWDVYGDESVPFAHWEYELEDRGAATLVRQTFTHGPGVSGMRLGVVQDPDRAAESIQGRLDQLAANMRSTLAAMESAIR
ncbi:polyketide cyclase/dehydrase/lipid transport protein [Kribbella pratensis]|uniref:Polyketide cyclase/dehydrase/lipid transport protein n=1 Tax=Kribbella pratensis TaxID=2512112 RepID=A0ABY2FGF4_9ACTN|nr:SRPBCC family protein [Kribbella pratensis]TDW90455.1 polyketide cyclase/dehydrase/lipid transport protein [Kribbella pratensis]